MFRKRCATKPALRSGFGAVITILEGQKMDNVSKVIDMYDISILVDGCEALGMHLSSKQTEQFVTYYRLLEEKNRVMNLTAITEWGEVQTRHYLDSLLIAGAADLRDGIRVLDMGTGAGFPGIPLKIAYPELDIVLADSLNKRILFLNDVIDRLGLSGICAVHGRAEDLGRKSDYRESFDLVVSRAVANLSSLSEYCIPFVKTDGAFISYKSSDVDDELKQAQHAISILGGGRPEVSSLTLPGTDIIRTFIKIRKERPTPNKYPRKAGTPSRDPLS